MSALPTLPGTAEQVYIDQAISKNNGRPGALPGILEAVQEHHPHKFLSVDNHAIGKSVRQASEHFVKGTHLEEGMLNRVLAVVRAYDPCLSCSTHALGMPAISISLLDADGVLLDEIQS